MKNDGFAVGMSEMRSSLYRFLFQGCTSRKGLPILAMTEPGSVLHAKLRRPQAMYFGMAMNP